MKSKCKTRQLSAITLIAIIAFTIISTGCKSNAPQEYEIEWDSVESGNILPASSKAFMPPPVAAPSLTVGGKDDKTVYLQSLDINVTVTGNIASTRYTMVFRNRTDRELEGELTFPLPDGRTVSHYALDINGYMREAVPVEKARATQVFEEIQQRLVDPGILERVEGNNFRTRIYPFPRYGTRTITIGYEEELPLENGLLQYRLPMAYSDAIEKFSIRAEIINSINEPVVVDSADENLIRFDRAGLNYVAAFARDNYKPSRAVNFAMPAPVDVPQVVYGKDSAYYFLASVAPRMGSRQKRWGDELAVVWDVSLSGRRRDLEREMEILDIVFSEKKNANVHLYFLNNRFNKINSKKVGGGGAFRVSGGNWDELKKVIEEADYDGGTDFSRIYLERIKGKEILFFSDGLSTLSDADFVKGNGGVSPPIHCIVTSAQADYSVMKLISGKTKGKFINANALSAEQLKRELLNETLQFLGTEHSGYIKEIYPNIATPVHGNFSVAGIISPSSKDEEITLLFGFGNKVEKRINVPLVIDTGTKKNASPLIPKIWAQKKIEELDLDFEKNSEELTELGKHFGIVTRNTSLIVLELISDYVLFKIPPPPELREEYLRELKRYDERRQWRRNSEGDIMDEAARSAEWIRWWRNMDFQSSKPRYPVQKAIPYSPAVDDDDDDNAKSKKSDCREEYKGETKKLRPTKSYDSDPRSRYNRTGPKARIVEQIGSQTKSTRTTTEDEDRRNNLAPQHGPSNGRFDATPAPGYGAGYGSGFGGGKENSGHSTGKADEKKSSGAFNKNDFAQSKAAKAAQPNINVKVNSGDKGYLKHMTGKLSEDYMTYRALKRDYLHSAEFYFDMAGHFYSLGDRETALRVLTSIAELGLEDAALYKMLGYRLKEFGEHTLQKFVFKKVTEWRPMEPQSYRDYALALADNGESKAAFDSLNGLLERQYSENIIGRSRGMEYAVVMEMNRLIAANNELDSAIISKDLTVDPEVDIRVVLNWNLNDTKIFLNVAEPIVNTDEFWNRYGINISNSGGYMSEIHMSGYGPVQYILKKAVRGRYRIYVSYGSHSEFASDAPAVVMVEIYTKYAGQDEQRRVVCLQLEKPDRGRDYVEVADFRF